MKAGRQGAGNGTRMVAVALCECGGAAPGIDLRALAEALRAHPLVDFVTGPGYTAHRRSLEELGRTLAGRGVSRVVVAGCGERLFGKAVRDALASSGLDPSLVFLVDFAEARTPRRAGRHAAGTALRLINAAVASLSLAEPVETIEAAIAPSCLVVGAGVAGMAAAAALARRGVKVVLVEKEKQPGGLVRRLNAVFPAYTPAQKFIEDRRAELEGPDIELMTGAEPVSMSGHVGDYEVALSNGKTVKAGTIVVAAGGALLRPEGLFGYGRFENVITQMDLEGMMAAGRRPGENVVMIQCAGSRNPERPYCSRICCTASIKNTVLMKEKYPGIKVTILSRGFAEYAGDLDRAREMGVEIIRYSPERPPAVSETGVEVYDDISEREATIPADCVVLAVPIVPSESAVKLARVLRLPTDRYGFIIEPEPRLRPGEYLPRGIFVAGCAHWPATITESVVQGYSAASRAFDLIAQGKVSKRAFVAELEEELCRGCGRCADECMHGAIEMLTGEDGIRQARHIPVQCTGCGVCVSVCPSGAFSLRFITGRQIGSVIEAIT